MWSPDKLPQNVPRYQAIVRALERDIARGELKGGDSLPPQRELAFQLGLSVGTVVRAYTIAQQRGLTTAIIGRGTFVHDPNMQGERSFFGDGAIPATYTSAAEINLSLNVPPAGHLGDVLGQTFKSLATAPELQQLLRYGPHHGFESHRESVAKWIAYSTSGQLTPPEDSVIITNGAQGALATIIASIASPGDMILTEEVTYAGIKAISSHMRTPLYGVAVDEQGACPESLDKACELTGAKIFYVMPTLQNPTGATMGQERRKAIARVAKERGLTLLEDDVYGFLVPGAPPPLTTMLPGQSFYIGGFSKCFAPGLRVGYAVVPPGALSKITTVVRSTHWMTSPILAEIVTRWVNDGKGELLVMEKRKEALERFGIAVDALENQARSYSLTANPGFHFWLPLGREVDMQEVVRRGVHEGILLTPPEAISVEPSNQHGIRLCLGAPHSQAQLKEGLTRLLKILTQSEGESGVSSVV